MEDNVVIKIISHGEKKYLTNLQQSSYSMKSSKSPFADPDVIKYDLQTAMGIVSQPRFKGFGMKVQVVDINGTNHYNTVDDVINEEVQKFLTEGYTMEHENFKFVQRMMNSSFYNYETFSTDFDVDINESDIVISWHISFGLNDFGVENFMVDIDGVTGTYMVDLLNKQTDELEQENDKDIAEFQWKFNVDDATLYLGKTLYVNTLDFDFKTKTCRVTFFDETYNY